jgi:von Willebrand factor type A domain/Aerotolerance regulator N-terminal
MNLGVAQWAMLWGLAGVAIPVLIHLLNRRKATVVDWGAMQFLELGRRAQRKFQVTELLLMMGRMLVLGLVALALARPFWTPKQVAASARVESTGQRRDVVLIIDGSDSMDRRADGTTPRTDAQKWLQSFLKRLEPGDSVGVLLARDRVSAVVDPPSFDRARVSAALSRIPPSHGSSDLPAALAEAFRILEKTRNPSREVVILSDGQRLAWRPGETERWALLRELHARLPVKPRIWSLTLNANAKPEGADGTVGPLELSRGLISPNLPITISTTIANAGPGPLTRTIELLVDGVVEPGSARTVGPLPTGSKTPVSFRATIASPGSHVVTVRLAPGEDPLAANDRSDKPVDVIPALGVLLVNGEPSAEPFGGETDFLRAALAPTGDDTPQVKASVIKNDNDFNAESLDGQKVVILANVDRLESGQSAAIAEFLGRGGGVLVAVGDRTDVEFANSTLYQDGRGWLPARLGDAKGDFPGRKVVAHPAVRSFNGPALIPFGQTDDAPLREADLFSYRVLEPATRAPAASVAARLDTGDPWIVERPFGDGRVMLLAGPLDAEGGTLPVNPDFVPWIHELVFHLADSLRKTHVTSPGEPIVFDLDPAPAKSLERVSVETPSGSTVSASIERTSTTARVHFAEANEPGIYRFDLPDPIGSMYVAVAGDGRELDAEPLAAAEMTRLAAGWPLVFESDPARLTRGLFSSGRQGPTEFWRYLVLAALGGLCVEVWMTRRLAKSRGIADVGD